MPRIARPTPPLADVNLLPRADGSGYEVVVCFMPDVDHLVGTGVSRAALALDASRSAREAYGHGGPFVAPPNVVQCVARKLGELLCGVAHSGRVSLVYWAVGPGGGGTQPVGDFDAAGCAGLAVSGPAGENAWGTGTKLLPAVREVVERVGRGADFTIGVFLTDGLIEDEADCFAYCLRLGQEVAARRRGTVKLVLVGVGPEVAADQLRRFNDLFEGTSLQGKVDLWAAGVADDMRDMADVLGVLFGELIGEETVVAERGSVWAGGREVAAYPDGLPGKFRFALPAGAEEFVVRTPTGDVAQDVSEALWTTS